MKVAIPRWQGRVSPVFDVARELAVFEIGSGGVSVHQDLALAYEDFSIRAAQLARNGINILICGAISRPLELAVSRLGIEVVSQVCGNVEEVIAGFVNGTLKRDGFLMPGCRGRQHRLRGQRGRGYGGT